MCIFFFRMTGTYVTVNGKECLNLATFNFLGLLNKKNIHVSNNICDRQALLLVHV